MTPKSKTATLGLGAQILLAHFDRVAKGRKSLTPKMVEDAKRFGIMAEPVVRTVLAKAEWRKS